MADTFWRLSAVVLLVLALFPYDALAQPVGDFGRVKPGVLSDVILPSIQRGQAKKQGHELSSFALTDEEDEMHDRIFRFTVAPHAQYWFEPYRRAVLYPGPGKRPLAPDSYYKWLKKTDYASSHTRFATIADDVDLDVATLPETFEAICTVIRIDEGRQIALAELDGLEPVIWRETQERLGENHRAVIHFVLALDYRYRAYDYALNHFLVETPHLEAVAADAALAEMVIWLDRAERHEFCVEGAETSRWSADIITPRVLIDADEGMYRK